MPVRGFFAADLDALAHAACGVPRRRMNLNLHASASDPCQRLFNAIEPDSYVRPHRHASPPLAETMVAVRGSFLLVEFDDAGVIVGATCLAPEARARNETCIAGAVAPAAAVVEVHPGSWHTVIALEPGSIFFEAKAGPYDPLAPREFAPWSPEEGDPAAPAWWEALRQRAAAPP